MKNYMTKAFLTVAAAAFVLAGGYHAQSIFASGRGDQAQSVSPAESAYTKYQELSYTDAAGNVLPVTVLANEKETEFNLQFDYYGTDASLTAEKIGDGQYRITNGDFFQTAGQNLVKTAVAKDNWKAVSLR